MKKIQPWTILLVFSVLILAGCSNIFIENSIEKQQFPEASLPGIPEGFGAVQVSLTRGVARTVIPDPVELNTLRLEYWFVKDGGAAEKKEAADGKFILEAGNYALTVKGLLDANDPDSLAAQGDTTFTIIAGANAGTVNVTLRPVVTGEGAGSLEFGLQYPAGVTVQSLTLTRIAGDESFDLLNPAPGTSGWDLVTMSGVKDNIPVGYYLLQAVLKNYFGAVVGKSEAVHIYQNLTAKTALAEYTFTADDFSAYLVTNANDSGPGSLRQALIDAQNGQIVRVMLEPGSVIELTSGLDIYIYGSIIIEGNGVTLTPAASWKIASYHTRLLYIGNSAEVTVSRVHFKDSWGTYEGGAIRHNGAALTLESCIFSGNQTTQSGQGGGAIYSGGALTIRGCTFYGNTTVGNGGAVYFNASGKTLTLTGNLFYGNTAGAGCPVVYNAYESGTVSASYNVVDAAFGMGSAQCGWTQGAGDRQASGLPLSTKTFRLYGNSAKNVMGALPADYPAVDFYEQPISANAAAGAVQASTAGSGYFLGLSANNSAAGTLGVSPEPDEDGFVSGPFAITATPNSGYAFGYWLVDGVKTASAPTSLSAHTFVQAVFNRIVTVNIFTDGPDSAATPGTLRYALTNARDLDLIFFSGVTAGTTAIELESALPWMSRSITIAGNGITLARATQLYFSGSAAEVTVSRVHFKNGVAIQNSGTLTLESCIFSGNQRSEEGGAIHSTNTLTLRGCTFYGNVASSWGGAVYFSPWDKTLTLTGNLFYGNTASYSPVVYMYRGTISASYNVVDSAFGTGGGQCGWAQELGDTWITGLPISPKTFKLLSGSGAAGVIDTLPADYPTVDFYGQPINVNAAAGAVQASTSGSGYYLDLSVNNSMAGTLGVSPQPDADGLVSGPFVITATPKSECTFGCWLVNGVKTLNAPTSLSDHAWVQAVFNRAVTVNIFTDGPDSAATPGTLRYALTNAQDGDHISFIGVTAGTTAIELESALPSTTKSLTIAGNGITLTRAVSWTAVSGYGGLLYTSGSTGEVTISRVHFKNGRATAGYPSGAIHNNGILTLESCIFSGNQSGGGGAIYSGGALTIRGCTFYGNSASNSGGAVSFGASGKTLTLTGNLFYGNTAPSYPVVYCGYGTVIASYNVVDVTLGTGSSLAGWTPGTGDTSATTLPISPKTFKLLSGSEAASVIDSLPADYPAVDFYGQAISANIAAGAVQASTAGSGYFLGLSANNSAAGTLGVSPEPDEDGFVSGPFAITATPNTGYTFGYWLVNGTKTSNAPTSLLDHAWVQAVFNRIVTVNIFTDGAGSATTPGTLRYTLTNAQDGDHISFTGVIPGTTAIELGSALPEITKSLTIAGNGVTLTRAASWPPVGSNTRLLDISSSTTEVTVSRVHLKNGPVTGSGGGIRNNGTLTLESCIFSGNQTSSGAAYGRAISSSNALTIRGCAFYGNYGGAVYFSASGQTLILMGNLFYGNTASSFPVVCIDNGTVNASYNVVDVAFGTGSSQCGWTQGSGDTSATTLPISPKTFKLLSGSEAASVIDSLPADYPVVDFYGQPISTNAAAGAAQAAAGSGYYLGLSVNNDLAGTVGVSPPSNADGLFSAPFTITASPNSGYTVGHWLVNGIKTVSAPTSLSDHAWVQVVFNRTVTVNVFADGPGSATTPGTLRYALTNVQEGDVISFSGVTAGSTVIELERDLPQITKSIAIAGNGVTLTRAASWTAVDTNTGLLSVSGSAGEVTVGRVLFKDGRAMEYGGAIYNNGTLTLESCIFSGNQNAGSYGYGGGAINSANTLTIKGCTFYGNSASNSGGAVCFSASGKTLTLTGNLFYGNTAPSYPVVSPSGTVDASYNVVDVTLGTGSSLAGWTPGTGDTYITTGDPIDAGFAPNPGSPGMTEIGIVPADLADFPTTDFYGNTRTFPGGAAGAVK